MSLFRVVAVAALPLLAASCAPRCICRGDPSLAEMQVEVAVVRVSRGGNHSAALESIAGWTPSYGKGEDNIFEMGTALAIRERLRAARSVSDLRRFFRDGAHMAELYFCGGDEESIIVDALGVRPLITIDSDLVPFSSPSRVTHLGWYLKIDYWTTGAGVRVRAEFGEPDDKRDSEDWTPMPPVAVHGSAMNVLTRINRTERGPDKRLQDVEYYCVAFLRRA
ncbi:MAG: hypothetical protein AAF517_22280 [Planctomycetota bacterium]